MKVIALCSGGMDSVVAMFHAQLALSHQVVAAVSFNYGSKHAGKEIGRASYQAGVLGVPHIVVELPFVHQLFKSHLLSGQAAIPDGHYADEVMKQTVVPFRNGIMLSIAAGIAESQGAEALVIAAHAGDHAIYPDCRSEFMLHMRSAISLGTYAGIQVLSPFLGQTKADIVSEGARLGVDFSQTWSCYKGGEKHCGKCGTCIERREAFYLAHVTDPTPYAEDAPTLAELVACGFKYKEKQAEPAK